MDQITQLNENVTPVAHSINLKLWGGLFAVVLVVAIGAIFLTGKTTLYKGNVNSNPAECSASGGVLDENGICNLPEEEQVTEAPVLTTIAITSLADTLTVGSSTLFAADTLDQVLWSSNVPDVGTIDPTTGLFTAVAEGFTNITATSGETSSVAITVTVNAAEQPVTPVAGTTTVAEQIQTTMTPPTATLPSTTISDTIGSAEAVAVATQALEIASAAPVTATPPPLSPNETVSGYEQQGSSATAGATAGATQMRGAYVQGTVIRGRTGPEILLYLGILPIAWGLRRIKTRRKTKR